MHDLSLPSGSIPVESHPADLPSPSADSGSQYQTRQPLRTVVNRVDAAADVSHDKPARYFHYKSIVDPAVTAVLMIVALPLMLVVALVVMICDGRPVFFRQVRVGKHGRTFQIWKFRTMQRNAERKTGPVWSCESDPRVTRLGRWLRSSHLDELPQFLNVLAGDMNLVGPRPERPEFVETLANDLPDYHKRTLVRPGITGHAQLRLGYDKSVAGIPEKVACDLHYIRTASFLGDFTLLASTLPHVAKELYLKWLRDRHSTQPDHETAVQGARQETGRKGRRHQGSKSPKSRRYPARKSYEEKVA